MMKILEAEQWQKSANPHEVALLQQQQEEDKVGSTTAQETKSVDSPVVRPLEGAALTRIPPANTGAPHPEARKAEGHDECKGSETWLLLKGEPLFKGRFPHLRPKRHGQGLPRCAPGFPSYDMGARSHVSYKLARSAKKVNRRTGSVQPPYGYSPSHLHRNQRSRRRTAVRGACNRPAVIRPSTFTATSGQGGEPMHKERATARGCASPRLRPVVQPLAWGPSPHVIHPACRFLCAEKSHRHSRQYRAFSRPLQKAEEIKFSKPMQRLEAPRTWPNEGIECEGHGPVSRGDRRGSRRDHGLADSNCINGRTGAASQSPVKLWPHLQAHILP
jgi:hypothetical protein